MIKQTNIFIIKATETLSESKHAQRREDVKHIRKKIQHLRKSYTTLFSLMCNIFSPRVQHFFFIVATFFTKGATCYKEANKSVVAQLTWDATNLLGGGTATGGRTRAEAGTSRQLGGEAEGRQVVELPPELLDDDGAVDHAPARAVALEDLLHLGGRLVKLAARPRRAEHFGGRERSIGPASWRRRCDTSDSSGHAPAGGALEREPSWPGAVVATARLPDREGRTRRRHAEEELASSAEQR